MQGGGAHGERWEVFASCLTVTIDNDVRSSVVDPLCQLAHLRRMRVHQGGTCEPRPLLVDGCYNLIVFHDIDVDFEA